MGANKSVIPKQEPETSENKFLLLATTVIIALILVRSLNFEKLWGEYKLSPIEEEKLYKRLREIDESEQYALLAIEDSWYPCLHKGRTTCFLKKGEVWKYGVTSKGQTGRYPDAFLIKNRVSYFIQYSGTFSECLKQEQIQLFNYPYLPENLARDPVERLPRPPYNSIMR